MVGAGAALGLAGCSGSPEAETKAPAEEAKPASEPAATTSAASNQPAFLTPPDPIPESEIIETVDCDIVICGAGICGLPAAMLAAENGANVHVVEKGSTYGLFRLCTAGFNSDVQTKLGLTTDRKEFITSTWAITNGVQGRMSSYGLWFDNSGPYVNWLEGIFNEKGYQLIPAASLDYKITNDGVDMPGASPLWQAFAQMIFFAQEDGGFFATGDPVDWTGVMEAYATEKGATFHYNAPAVQLLRDDSGRCTGVIAKNESDEYVRYNASKGVLLTTGDMAADREMMAHYNVSLSKIVRYNINTNDTGDGQKMGMWIGADMDEFACGDLWPFAAVMMDGTLPTTFEGTHFYAGVANLPVLMVDGAGRRLMAENLPFQSPSSRSSPARPTAARGASGTAPGRRSSPRAATWWRITRRPTPRKRWTRTWRTASRSSLIPSRSCANTAVSTRTSSLPRSRATTSCARPARISTSTRIRCG